MRKPSIFSSDYEKQMRKRKRIIIGSSLVVILVVGCFGIEIIRDQFNFTKVKNKLQAWVDEDVQEEENIIEEPAKVSEEEQIKNNYLNLKIEAENDMKLELDKDFNIINVVENKKSYQYDISTDKKSILILDSTQNIKVFSNKGEEKDYTLKTYSSPDGDSFNKDQVLKSYTNYKWHFNPKFINGEKIAYISNMPYFGLGDNQFLWVYDIKSNKHSTIWQSKGKEIKINNIGEKGLEVSIDGNTKFIDNNGNLVQ